MSVTDQGSPAPSLRRLPFTIRLAPQLVNHLLRQCDKPAEPDQVNGLLFGLNEEGVVIAQVHRRFADGAQAGGSATRASQDKLLEQHLLASQKQSETSLLNLVGWYAIRAGGGLIASDLAYHNWYFPRPHDLALILRPDPQSGVFFELYCRTIDGLLNEDGHRVGMVRLSNSPLESAVEIVPRARIQDDFFMRAYDLSDLEEDKPLGWKGTLAVRYRKAFSFLGLGEDDEDMLPDPILQRQAQENARDVPKPAPPTLVTGTPNGSSRSTPAAEQPLTALQLSLRSTAPHISLDGNAGRPLSLRDEALAPPLPSFTNTPARTDGRRHPWLPASLLFGVTSLLTFGVVYYLQVSDRLPAFTGILVPQSNLGLKVEAQSDRLLVSWNRQNSLVREASSGSLQIDDGQQKRQVLLDASHVMDGSILYRPNSEDVTFRLEVRGKSGRQASESIRVLEASKPESSNVPQTPSLLPSNGANPGGSTLKPSAYRPPPAVPSAVPKPEIAGIKEEEAISPPFALPASVDAPTTGETKAAADKTKTAEKAIDQAIQASPEEPSPKQFAAPEQRAPKPVEVQRLPAPQLTEPTKTVRSILNGPVTPALYQPPIPKRQVLPDISSLPPGVLMQAGQLEVVVRVDETGKVTTAQPLADGRKINQLLVASAVTAARQWRFSPAVLRGRAVSSQHSIIFQFSPRR